MCSFILSAIWPAPFKLAPEFLEDILVENVERVVLFRYMDMCLWSVLLVILHYLYICVVDIEDDPAACRSGSQCKNHARIDVVVYSRRNLLERRLSSLSHFAKRRPSLAAPGDSFEQNSADESLSLAEFSGPSGSLVVVPAPLGPPRADTQTGSSYTQASPIPPPVSGESTLVVHVCAAFSLVQLG